MNNSVHNFGCRLNAYESEVIKENLRISKENNIAIFNTCAVTKEAERKVKQAIRKFSRENPETKVVATGCAVQISPDSYLDMPEVNYTLGNQEKLEPEQYNFSENTEKGRVNDIMELEEVATHMVPHFQEQARAFLQIQNGCNHRCTFCIIPYGRGNSRSVPVAKVIENCQALVNQGYNEIVLTGVDVTDYGLDLPATPKLGNLIKRILKLVPDLPRLRLSSIDVAEIDEDLMELIKYESRFMPHLHISLQSGDNMILKRMKRRHTREQVIDFADEILPIRPKIVFGADIICGFPTETDEMFDNSLKLVRDLPIPHLHAFTYSEREGTPAAKIPADKQVPVNIRKERTKILNEEAKKALLNLQKDNLNKPQKVIVENGKVGKTEQFLSIKLEKEFPLGSIQEVNATEFTS